MKEKSGMASDTAVWWILAIITLVVVLGVIAYLLGWFENEVFQCIKNLRRCLM